MSSGIEHTDVGAYALGLLDDDDRRVFEAHLAVCEFCIVELADFSDMRELFSRVRPLDVMDEEVPEPYGPPPSENVVSLLERRRESDQRRRKGTALLGAAAAVALLAGGVTAGVTMAPEQPTSKAGAKAPARPGAPEQGLPADAERVSAADSRTQAKGTVAMQSRAWGTAVVFEMTSIRGPLDCRLVAVSRKGRAHVVTGWQVPEKGYGVPGSPTPLLVHGGTALQRQDIARFEARTKDGRKLLSIPV